MDFLTAFGMWGIGLLTGFALARHRQDRLAREAAAQTNGPRETP